MARWDAEGLWWFDQPASTKRGERTLGPMPEIPETGWRPPTELPDIYNAPWIAIDCETYDPELQDFGPGWARGKGHIVGVSIATVAGTWYFPIRHTVQPELNMDPERVLNWLRWSLTGNQPKIGANLLYDLGWLQHEGIVVNGPVYDVQYAEALLDETAQFSLEELGWRHLRRGKLSDILKEWARSYYMTSEKLWRKDIYRCPVTLVGPYAEEDARMPYEILMKQWPMLVHRNLMPLFELECKLLRLLMAMRFRGQQVDIPYAERLRDNLAGRIEATQKEAEYICGTTFNANSGNSLADAFDRLGLKYPRTAPTEKAPYGNPSFTKDFLKTVNHDFVKRLLTIRELEKLKGTFVESYLLDSHVNGKIYCSFHPLMGEGGGARTGRFSGSDPNLQNIPTRTEEGKLIRTAFIMDHGHAKFRSYDYSQIEYRMLMHFAVGPGADEFRERYWADSTLDFHKMTGAIVKDKAGIELQRSYIKNVNFGIVYGVGVVHLAEMLGVPLEQAKQILDYYDSALPFAKETMRETMKEVGHSGICTTILGRQTHFDEWEQTNWGEKDRPLPYAAALAQWGPGIQRAYLYKALNYRLQGSAADMMKTAMVRCFEDGVFAATGVPRMTVHDELTFSDPGSVPEDAWREMQHICETCVPGLRVPIKMEGAIGMNWGECK